MKKEESSLSLLLPMAVFALMALCLMGVLLTGAGVYQRISRSGDESSRSRTAALYLSTRVRQAASVQIEDFGGCQALTIPEKTEDGIYLTRVYCYDGTLRELICQPDAPLSPEDGEILLQLDMLDMTLEDGLLTLDMGKRQLVFSAVSEREAME